MSLRFTETALKGVILIETDAFRDNRGYFTETFHAAKYREGGISAGFVQDNRSHSVKATLRGLHYQYPNPQGKLVSVMRGEIFDVAVDIRVGSPTFGRWVSVVLSESNGRQLYIPEGFAHGFCVMGEEADVLYKCTAFYEPANDRGLLWSDSELGIDWPVKTPILSAKDAALPCLNHIRREHLPACR